MAVAQLPVDTAGNSVPSANPWTHAALFVLMALLAAVFLPCYFRFGAGKGLIVFSAIAVGAMIAFSLLLQLALYLAPYAHMLADPDLWRETAAKFSAEEKVRLAHKSVGILALLAAAALLLSAGLSVRFFEKRDL